ncbi:MAG: NFACT RNA binding domain-containing protein [Erysipelotrichaceae bacterium]|nr:NFACT RNA binding domain-containing protein [Erysipelotrichaceae bacterium]MDY5252500.1 NFACT RNA binding domain-containing protein [Erysipelotrichaceae bacterium]
MALDAIMIAKIIPDIQAILPCRINKIYQISKTELLFQLKTHDGKKQLVISCHSLYNRINLSNRKFPTPEEPGNFVMVLRKYLEGASILNIKQDNLDRHLKMEVSFTNGIGDRVKWFLSIELMGKYANVILVNDQGIIVDALKRIPPFENNLRTIHPGAKFKDIEPQDKLDPFSTTTFDHNQHLTKQFLGFSPLLEDEVRYRLANAQSFTNIMEQIKTSNKLYIANKNNEAVFHCIELTHLGHNVSYDIHEGLDVVYFHLEEKDRIKQISGDIFKYVKAQIKHYKQKLPKLLEAYDESLDCDRWKEYGDLLYTYNIQDTKGQKVITLNSFYDDQPIKIPLDPKLDGKQNANKCYTKYHKQKKAQAHLLKQIEITQDELDYFIGIEQQLQLAQFHDAKEIKDELIKLGYLKKQQQKIRKNKKEEVPKYSVLNLDNTKILFGKNNLQNDYLTFKLANKNDLWFHAKDYHGAHVIVQGETSEAIIRLAANIAAYYSSGRLSSSVPVNYCMVKNLKKIPQAKPGMVQLTTYKTIYIDPDIAMIEQAKQKEA